MFIGYLLIVILSVILFYFSERQNIREGREAPRDKEDLCCVLFLILCPYLNIGTVFMLIYCLTSGEKL